MIDVTFPPITTYFPSTQIYRTALVPITALSIDVEEFDQESLLPKPSQTRSSRNRFGADLGYGTAPQETRLRS